MIVALGIPAYRRSVSIQTAYAWAQDAATVSEFGWSPVLLWADMHGVARARNVLVNQAYECGADLLLMMDNDTYPMHPAGGLAQMWGAMQDTDAAVVGASVAVRDGKRMNCQPALPGEIYDGQVGTAYMLCDLRKLRDVPRPWFEYKIAADGITCECGEDIGFCRLVKEHGHRVVVNYHLPMGHIEQVVMPSRP